MRQIESVFRPLPPQWAFLQSEAKIRGYGGAMGGGKSRALCEDAFDEALDNPGLKTLICRKSHTSIVETTRKTMTEQVIPPEMLPACRKKESQGEDWIRLPNGSVFHFVGLDNVVRWFSAEIGKLVFDEAHEIDESDVLTLRTRLRQPRMRHRTTIAFNPANPGHWLQKWFILGAAQTDHGFYKPELWVEGASAPLGDCEFVFAKATDNVYLPDGYIDEQLAGLPEFLRRRYLEGLWEFITGTCYFDVEALSAYQSEMANPRVVGRTDGEIGKEKIRVVPDRGGPLAVWKAPVREHDDPETGELKPAHRYIISVDVSSGGATDYSAIQVVDIENFEQVAEYQAKLDPDLLAVEAFRLGVIYNGALIAPEVTGGWGFTVVRELERLMPRYRGPAKPRIYTRRIEDRLSKKWTDKLGWDTTVKTRAVMLDTLERVLREREFRMYGHRTLSELATFVRDEKGRPAAQPGCNDDLVITLAMAVTLAANMPRQLRRLKPDRRSPQFTATGYGY